MKIVPFSFQCPGALRGKEVAGLCFQMTHRNKESVSQIAKQDAKVRRRDGSPGNFLMRISDLPLFVRTHNMNIQKKIVYSFGMVFGIFCYLHK